MLGRTQRYEVDKSIVPRLTQFSCCYDVWILPSKYLNLQHAAYQSLQSLYSVHHQITDARYPSLHNWIPVRRISSFRF